MRISANIRRRALLLGVPGLIVGLALGTVLAVSASASGTGATGHAARAAAGWGWIRLAHLSPNTPAVDVYLYSFGDPSAFLVLHHVAYGTVSPYERVAAGDYSVAMRGAGAAPSTAAVLSTSVSVSASEAYTVAGLGPASGLRLAVLPDRLSTPRGKSLVRVIQASLRQHVVTVHVGSQPLASDLAFGSVSSYQAVPSGAATVQVTAAGATDTSTVTFGPATVHTLVVMDGSAGLDVTDLEDAAGNGAIPAGGVATGFGGTAGGSGSSSPLPWVLAIVAGSLLALAGGARLRVPARVSR